LRNHLLDPDGHFYKTTFFEFYRYTEHIRDANDPLYNRDEFEKILEIKGKKDHTKLIQMLNDVNNYSIPIEKTFEKYFNADNFFTWLAFNILVGNLDTQSQNYYLYSPQNSNTWYFIPWDYDGAFSRLKREEFGRWPYEYWEYGVSNYWGVVLSNRLLRIDSYRDMLTEKVEELYVFLSEDRISSMLETYRQVIEPYISRLPDSYYFPGSMNEFNESYLLIPMEVESNYQLYYESLEAPMPFYLGTPSYNEDELYFNWEDSYDFDGQNIVYDFTLSRDWEFQDIIITKTITNKINVSIPHLEPGTYFWKVTATNEDGKVQYPFDYYRDAEGKQHSGMKYLLITEDGEILEE